MAVSHKTAFYCTYCRVISHETCNKHCQCVACEIDWSVDLDGSICAAGEFRDANDTVCVQAAAHIDTFNWSKWLSNSMGGGHVLKVFPFRINSQPCRREVTMCSIFVDWWIRWQSMRQRRNSRRLYTQSQPMTNVIKLIKRVMQLIPHQHPLPIPYRTSVHIDCDAS